jgi:primosomal protein N' (replication factor Y) (superfamily II helicase)
MTTYLEIAVNVPQVSGVFDYHLPPELQDKVGSGSLVTVPFGSQVVHGVVVRQVDQPSVAETKPVLNLVDPAAVVTPVQIQLAFWLAKETFSSLAPCVSLMLPAGLIQEADTEYAYAARPEQVEAVELSPLQQRLLKLIHKAGSIRGRQIETNLPRLDWKPAARTLVKLGLVTTQSVLPSPRVQPKLVRTACLACPPEETERFLALHELSPNHNESRKPNRIQDQQVSSLGRAGSPALARRQAMLRYLIREPGWNDVTWLYAESGGRLEDLYVLEEFGLAMIGESESFRDPLANLGFVVSQPPALTRDQQKAWQVVQKTLQDSAQGHPTQPILLHGVTGSGKTEIYLRAVQETLEQGRQAIVLVPEIALTPQTVNRFVSRFPGRVGLVHSGLSQGERYDTWRRARLGHLSIVVGARSALFTPFPNLGLIVIDECHDDAYYQSEGKPYYHAREIAVAYARMINAACLMGSATPDVNTFIQSEVTSTLSDAQIKKLKFSLPSIPIFQYIRLPNRILAHHEAVRSQLERLDVSGMVQSHYKPFDGQAEATDLPPVQIIDMREELKSGNRSIFSRELTHQIGEALHSQQQAILFLNRRGTATYVFCRGCGFVLECPKCDLPLTYHQRQAESYSPDEKGNDPVGFKGKLLCHHCGYRREMPVKCPSCGSEQIRHFGTGTERVADEVQALFPEARILRWDWESTRQKGAHEVILSHFTSHRADILVGTQMLSKGLDLPLVTLVGVVLADVGLALPDYTANERAFQVLTQVAGRAGRSILGGRVIFQTFQPEHYVLRAASEHNFEAFAWKELEYRQRFGYPPYFSLVRLEYRNSSQEVAERAAREMAERIRGWLAADDRRTTRMVGPVPPFFSRVGGLYRWHIILRGPQPVSLLDMESRKRFFSDWQVEVNPPSLL